MEKCIDKTNEPVQLGSESRNQHAEAFRYKKPAEADPFKVVLITPNQAGQRFNLVLTSHEIFGFLWIGAKGSWKQPERLLTKGVYIA